MTHDPIDSEKEPTATPSDEATLSKGERKKLRREQKKLQQDAAAQGRQRKATFKKTAVWSAVGLVGLAIVWLVITTVRSPVSPDVIAPSGLHWHADLAVSIKGQPVEIPANIGMGGAMHADVHTHKVNDQMHYEMKRAVRKQDLRLGRFFEEWGETFTNQCVIDSCNGPEGTVKMTVNGQPNTEFDNYVIQDKDRIEVRYE